MGGDQWRGRSSERPLSTRHHLLTTVLAQSLPPFPRFSPVVYLRTT